MEIAARTKTLVLSINSEFDRVKRFSTHKVTMTTEIDKDNVLWLNFSNGDIKQSVSVPLPIVLNNKLEVITYKDIIRAVPVYWLEKEQKYLTYHDIMYTIICDDIHKVCPEKESSSSLLNKVTKMFSKKQAYYIVSQLQKAINNVLYKLPLHETDMNTWAVNRRVVIIDPDFNDKELNDPNKRLDYQVNKNTKYYGVFGWSSIGLSDSVLAGHNHILSVDLRNTIPFGYHHNPQRNLYSTLGMKGDELPRVRSKTMQDLIDNGVSRHGWNLFTAIVDTDLVFEDQILVNKKHRDKGHHIDRRYVIYGDVLFVNVGDMIETGDRLGSSKSGDIIRLDLKCDGAEIIKIERNKQDVGGELHDAYIITVRGFRFFKDGTKFSNLSGNKGVIRLFDLGYAIDPRNGKEIPIDVMISATSINRRKNFSQILEALVNNIHEGDEPIVIPDNYSVKKETVQKRLEKAGFPSDGTWMTHTPWGEFEAICGKMFWGVTKDPEDQSWNSTRPLLTDNKELRVSGLKFSHVEIKALTTRFGPNNPIIREIMSHMQGPNILKDEIRVLNSLIGEFENYPVVDAVNVKFVDTSLGMFHNEATIHDTILDDMFLPNGFILKLPVKLDVIYNKNNVNDYGILINSDGIGSEYTTNKMDRIFIPNALLRRCWRHPSGKWGFSTIGAYVNYIVEACNAYINNENATNYIEILKSVSLYFENITKSMGTKRGEIATHGMCVRYPHSTRATVTLANNLQKNTIELHEDMARNLKIDNGDVVIIERFPCLGFMSVKPQYVKITNDPMCRDTIRASGNSLVSMDLDFDGDTVFIAAFYTPEAVECLKNEMKNPNAICDDKINLLNNNKTPQFKEMSLEDYELIAFKKPSVDEHASIVRKAVGVKAHTGPVIALAYNLMRITERVVPLDNTFQHASLEMMLHFLGNTVFQQKHGIESLQEAATDALCTADVERMVELGFERTPSNMLCSIITNEANRIGVTDLKAYHSDAKKGLCSKIINKIVRIRNKIYFASRSQLSPIALIEHLKADAVDLPSQLFKIVLETPVESVEEQLRKIRLDKELKKAGLKDNALKRYYADLSEVMERIMLREVVIDESKQGDAMRQG